MDLIHVIISCELEWIQVTQWWTNFVRTNSADWIIIVRQNSSEQNTFFRLHSGEQIVLGYIQNSDDDSADDSVFPHLANGYTNPVEIGVSSIDLSDDKDTKSNEEDDDERMRVVEMLRWRPRRRREWWRVGVQEFYTGPKLQTLKIEWGREGEGWKIRWVCISLWKYYEYG